MHRLGFGGIWAGQFVRDGKINTSLGSSEMRGCWGGPLKVTVHPSGR